MLDSGATTDSYLSKTIYLLYRDFLPNIPLHPSAPKVYLGDSTTCVPILAKTSLPITVYPTPGMANQNSITIDLPVSVIDTHIDLIIGLPCLLNELLEFYIDLLRTHGGTGASLRASPQISVVDLIPPFTQTPVEALEDDIIPDPQMFRLDDPVLGLLASEVPSMQAEYLAKYKDQLFGPIKEDPRWHNLMSTLGKQVHVPTEWLGIKDVVIDVAWKELPPPGVPRVRPINPRLFAAAAAEIQRLKGHMLVPHQGDRASNLVVAPKATAPFIRLCGDYPPKNRYMEQFLFPIPHVKLSLVKISGFRLFANLDMMNSFHQFRLSDQTSAFLSVITPWGQFRPLFMPEGIGPASGILQFHMSRIFADFDEWTVIIFDNFLILADDAEDLLQKTQLFLQRCRDHNLYLKLSKCEYGLTTALFFGYEISHNSYRLQPSRSQALQRIPFPKDVSKTRAQMVTRMQSYLGSALFFADFIPHYSERTALLYQMTHADFNWIDESTWTENYRTLFEAHKAMLLTAFDLFYPDYSLEWVVRVDASQVGVGGVLAQVPKDHPNQLQPIAFVSHKFSPAATQWDVFNQEAFAIFYVIRTLAYYLRGKNFILETDHRNLLWIEKSLVPRVIRMYVYLASFVFLVRHIAGKKNIIADMLSRSFPSEDLESEPHAQLTDASPTLSLLCSILDTVHGGRNGHNGVKRTWQLLNKLHPGHGLSVQQVRDFVMECPLCQKARDRQKASLDPLVRTLHADHARHVIAADLLQITRSKDGFLYLLVVINLFTKYTAIYPIRDKEARTVAMKLFLHASIFGVFDILHTDPGSEFISEVCQDLCRWSGTGRTFSLVDNPQADGVEPVNAQILRHLRCLVLDERIVSDWASEDVYPWIQLVINEQIHSETGVSPLEATFGSQDASAFSFRPATSSGLHEFVQSLDKNLALIRKISAEFQARVKDARSAPTAALPQNTYQAGDFVLHMADQASARSKLHSRNKGPYIVVSHPAGSNTVQVRSLVTDACQAFNSRDLMIFVGTAEEARRMAMLDDDQFDIDSILGYKGDPELRSTTAFLVRFSDGDQRWLPFSPDLTQTRQFETFCSSQPLKLLLLSAQLAANLKRTVGRERVTTRVNIGDTVYVDLRAFGAAWYASKADTLPHLFTHTNVVLGTYSTGPTPNTLLLRFPSYPEHPIIAKSWFIYLYGSAKTPGDGATILTRELVTSYSLS